MNLSPLVDTDLLMYRVLTSKEFLDVEEAKTAVDDSIKYVTSQFSGPHKLFLSPSNKSNFRYIVASIRPYKANRTSEKPPFFNEVKRFLIEERSAIVVCGAEADDGIASTHKPGETIVCSYDKDFHQLPGHHFDFRDGTITELSETAALINLYCQMLVGDDADNIPGIVGIGKGKAPSRLEGQTEEQMRDTIMDLYKRQYGEIWGPIAFKEIYTLVKLRTDLYG